MNFDELVHLKALQLKQLNTEGGTVNDYVVDQLIDAGHQYPQLRQVCAMVTTELFEKLDATCKTLEISKRRFVEAALQDAITRAETIVADVDPFPG